MSPRPLRFTITDAQIVEIRERYAVEPSLTHAAIAKEYNIGRGSATRIIRGAYRSDLGGPFTRGKYHRAPVVPGDCDIVYSLRAAAGFLGVKRASVREYLLRGRLTQEAAGLVTYDSLVAHQARQYTPPPLCPNPVVPTCCARCGEVDFDPATGLCNWCREEKKNGKYSWWKTLTEGT